MSSPQNRPPRQTDTSGGAARSLLTEWRWPLTVLAVVCLSIAATLYALGLPLAGFVDQIQGLLTGGAVLAGCLGVVRLFSAVRQMAGAERNSGAARREAIALREELAALREEVGALHEELAPLLELAAGERSRRRGASAPEGMMAASTDSPPQRNHGSARFPR